MIIRIRLRIVELQSKLPSIKDKGGLNLDLGDQLVGDLLAEELVGLAVLHVDVELPHQLQHLVHAAARAR